MRRQAFFGFAIIASFLMTTQAYAFGGWFGHHHKKPAPVPTYTPTPPPIYTPPPTSGPGSSGLSPSFVSPIRDMYSARCIDDLGWSNAAGSLPGIWDCNGMQNQNFNFSSNSTGYYSIQNAYNNLCLEVDGIGSAVKMEPCSGSATQEFQVKAVSNGVYELATVAGPCLDLANGDTKNGTNLVGAACVNSMSEQFAISAPAAENISLSVPPSGAKTISNIENLGGWKSCTGGCSSCPAYDPNCSNAKNSNMVPYVQQVSLPEPLPEASDNVAGLFEVDNGQPYTTSLWGHSIAPSGSYTHFLWDFYTYVDTSEIQNLEYDLYSVVNGNQYMLGSQCNYATGVWQGWDNATEHWVNTSAPCPHLTPNQWHHIVWDVSINPATQTYSYRALQIDGVTYAAKLSNEPARSSNWGSVVGVQVQIDTNQTGLGVNETIENMKVTMW